MFVFKIAKAIIKLFLGIVLGIGGIVLIAWFGLHYLREINDYGKDVSYMIGLYENTKNLPVGTYVKCPWYDCTEQFYKKTGNHNFCCKQHEVFYWDAVHAYEEMRRVEKTTGALYK